VVAKGALGLIAREAHAAKRNEFLQATTNPVDIQILGMEGRAYLLREMAKGLQLDVNKIIPDPERLKQMQAMQQEQQAAQQQGAPAGPPGAPPGPPGAPPEAGPPGAPPAPAGPQNISFVRDPQGNITGAQVQ
jgi:hypothetical protein